MGAYLVSRAFVYGRFEQRPWALSVFDGQMGERLPAIGVGHHLLAVSAAAGQGQIDFARDVAFCVDEREVLFFDLSVLLGSDEKVEHRFGSSHHHSAGRFPIQTLKQSPVAGMSINGSALRIPVDDGPRKRASLPRVEGH